MMFSFPSFLLGLLVGAFGLLVFLVMTGDV